MSNTDKETSKYISLSLRHKPEEIEIMKYLHLKTCRILTIILLILMLVGCASSRQVMDGDGMIDGDGEIELNEQNTEHTVSIDDEDMTPTAILGVIVGDSVFSIYVEDNSSAKAFIEEVNHGNVQIDMHDYGNFEKVGDLPWNLPTNDEELTTVPGDVILYQGNKITIYYDENTWNFTKLGHINATQEEIREAFGGKDDITAEFFVEWTE
jgi:hypothetical protein